jgi:hypothetical protein
MPFAVNAHWSSKAAGRSGFQPLEGITTEVTAITEKGTDLARSPSFAWLDPIFAWLSL